MPVNTAAEEDTLFTPALSPAPSASTSPATSAASASHTTPPGPIKDEEEDGTFDEEEEGAAAASCLRLPLTDNELFSTTLDSSEILKLVSKVIPELSLTKPSICRLCEDIQEHVHRAPALHLPVLSKMPTTWPSTNQAMDELWQEAVEGERRVAESGLSLPQGLDMRPEHLVKPFGSHEDPLLVLSSYPTADPASTVHLQYGIVNDLSNSSMSRLYTKLGFHVADLRVTGMQHVDIWPRRLDRKVILGNNSSVLTKMPKELLLFWQSFAFQCIGQSLARLAIVSGHSADLMYRLYLKDRDIHHDILWLWGSQQARHELPCAYIEWTDATKTTIRRLTLVVYHPEFFGRKRSHALTDLQRNIAFRERLFDYTSVLLYGEAHLPTFLTTGNWFYQMSTGILIPLTAFEQYEDDNDTLSMYLSRPLRDTMLMRSYIKKSPSLLLKKAMLYSLLETTNIEHTDPVIYWSGPDVIRKYGPYTLTYEFMARRYVEAKQGAKEKGKKRAAATNQSKGIVRKRLCTPLEGPETLFGRFQQRLLRVSGGQDAAVKEDER